MKKAISIIILFIVVTSCNKEYVQPRSGIFRGVFEMTGFNGGGYESTDCTISLNDVNGQFSFNRDTTNTVPYPCSGLYTIIDGTNIEFNALYGIDTSLDVNRHLYLDTVYTYYFDDTRLELTKKVDTILYEYKFIRY